MGFRSPLARINKLRKDFNGMQHRVGSAAHSIKEEIVGVLIFVACVWAVFLLDHIPGLALNDWFSLRPRTLRGLIGIPAMPLLHDNWLHILSNTLPLLVLLSLLAGSRARSWIIVWMIVLGGGCLTWLVGASGRHVGASGLVFGLVTFLLASGLFEKRLIPMGIAMLVGLLYGWTLIRNLVPFPPPGVSNVSYAGHWGGALAGIATAYLLTHDALRENRRVMKASR